MAIIAACLCHSSHHHPAFPSGPYKYRSPAAGPPLARLRGFLTRSMRGSKRKQSRETGGCPSWREVKRLARLSTSKKMTRPCRVKTKQKRRTKTSFVTRAMASLHVTSGTQITAAKTTASSTRPRRVHWPKNSVGPRHGNRPANDQGRRHVHLANNREEPMEVDPPPEQEERMEVDPPLTGQAWSPGMPLMSTMQERQAHRRSARPAPYAQRSLRANNSLGQNHRSGRLVSSTARHCRNK